jgi:hypothetical protein
MGYVIAGILVLLIVAAGVTVFVLRAARTGRGEAAADSGHGEGTPGSDVAIAAPDEGTPLGDTDQHAGEQTRTGETASDPEEAGRKPGAREPSSPGVGGVGEGGAGGEGEGSRPMPDSERLANRDR